MNVDVRALQELLASLGFSPGPIDGIYGQKTHGALTLANQSRQPIPSYIEGIDVSGHNGTINWKKVAAAGCHYAFVKVSEGTTHKHRSRQRNLDGARAWNIPVGAYHYALPRTYQQLKMKDARREAENFLSCYGTPQPDDLRPVCDLESGLIKTNHNYNAMWVLEWCRVVEAELGCKPILYTARWATVSRLLRADADLLNELAKFDLWWAEYRSEETKAPTKPMEPWNSFAIWQYTGSGKIDGISGRVDINRMRPETLAKLRINA